MFEFFQNRAEQKFRNRRAARMFLRDHGEDAIAMLDRRVDATNGRDRAHWKRVRMEAIDILANRTADD